MGRKSARFEATYIPYAIPFRVPFRTAGTVWRERRGILVRLDDGACVGLGEIVLRSGASVSDLLKYLPDGISERDLEETSEIPGKARPGIEAALLDLAARVQGIPLAGLLGGMHRKRIEVNATLGNPGVAGAAEEAERLAARGFSCIKLKISGKDPVYEEERLAAVRRAVGNRVALRIDANAAWDVEDAVRVVRRLGKYGLDYVEQPVVGIRELSEVRRRVETPIAADESVTDVAAVEEIAAAGAADLVILKPSVLGLRRAHAAALRAIERGLDAVVTSTLDTSVGVAAAAHLAATLPDPLRPCGLATVELLAGDLVCNSLLPHDGWVDLPAGPGLGVHLDEDAVRRWKAAPGSHSKS